MSTVERDDAEATRLRRVLNRSAVIQEERRRRRVRVQLIVASGVVAIAAVVGVSVVAFSPDATPPVDSSPAGNVRPPTTVAEPSAASRDAFAWESGVLGTSVAGPAYGAGRVFVMTADRAVVALDPADGDVLWSHPIVVRERDALAKTTATVDFARGVVLAAGPDVPLQALDARTGNLRWTTAGTSPTPAHRGVAVLDDIVAVANTTGVSAFDLTTGETRWTARTPAAQSAAGRGQVVVASAGNAVLGLDRSTGRIQWTTTLPANVAATARPTFESDDVVVVVDDNGGLHRLSTGDGRILTSAVVATCRPCTLPDQPAVSQPTVVAGRIIVGTATGVVAVDVRTGVVAWTLATPRPVTTSPVPSGPSSVVVAVNDPPALVELDAASGRVRRETPLPAEPSGWPLPLERRVVVHGVDGRVRAIAR